MRIKSCTGSALRIWGILKKVSWVESCLGRRRMTFACNGCARDRGRWKSQNRKNVYPSPYAEEPLNSKVIKSFVPNLRSRKCFSCFEIPRFYEHMLWKIYVHFPYLCLAMVHLVFLSNTSAFAKFRRHSLEQVAESIGLDLYANKTESMCFKLTAEIGGLFHIPR